MFQKIWLCLLTGFLFTLPSKNGKQVYRKDLRQVETAAITIAAASDLRYAMDSLVKVFHKEHPEIRVNLIYGSSGKFYSQIVNGAPFDLLFSADMDYPQKLQQQSLTASAIHLYAIGRIVLWSKKIDVSTKGMNALKEASVNKIAIANPVHAPYGKRAEESLKYYMLYDQVKSKLVLGENISQTAQYATSGAADLGIIALSLALNPQIRSQGKYYLIPEKSHQKLEQAYVVLKRAGKNPAASLFSRFISSSSAKLILTKYGFTLPK